MREISGIKSRLKINRGFNICRAITLKYPTSCIALHTTNSVVPKPTLHRSPVTWLKYHIARLTSASTPILSFGYIPSDFSAPQRSQDIALNSTTNTTSWTSAYITTLSYALADSPTGLLAFMFQLLRHPSSPSSSTTPALISPWTPSDILTWTNMYWFPGPEAPLRWLGNAVIESRPKAPFWRTYSSVPLGISYFRREGQQQQQQLPMWASAFHELGWLKRHGREARWALWELPEEVVRDLREFAESVLTTRRESS